MSKKYYALETKDKEADIYIFGDIVDPTTQEFWGISADVSGYSLAQEIKELDVDVINVHINSYGGYVSEGLAIYNSLKEHKAKIRTICDGFACSAASVVFMAGDERIMNNASLIMIHNAWICTCGDANQLRKDADDLEKITQASINAYMESVNISEEELKNMMNEETWILPSEALETGFATSIVSDSAADKAAASAKKALFSLLIKTRKLEPQAIDANELAAKVAELMKQSIEPPTDPDPPADGSPQENKPKKFIAAMFR